MKEWVSRQLQDIQMLQDAVHPLVYGFWKRASRQARWVDIRDRSVTEATLPRTEWPTLQSCA